ncbi:Clr5 domain-containing protein [Podospora conica]|nr:Clr5 domain-containing protein [Schizothecium conicum]
MFRPSKSQDWEPYRETIALLYETMKLKDVMLEMQLSHGFKATEKQYKTQLKKWNLDTKYIKASEYLAMVRIKREREASNPSKQTQFILRGRVVENKDITRFEKRASKKGTLQLDEDQDDGTTPGSAWLLRLTQNRGRRRPPLPDSPTGGFWVCV